MIKYLCRPFHKPDYEMNTNCRQFIEALRLQYGKYIKDTVDSYNPYKIIVTRETNNSYIIDHLGGRVATDKPLREIDEILFNTTTYDETVLPLHGAAVEYNGYVYVFLAPTTTGKTTLTAYLINYNFGYITEDCILLDKQTFKLFSYACPLHLRTGSLEVLQKYGINIANLKPLDDPAGIRYIYTPHNYGMESLPLGRIFFLKRSETENRITGMTSSESMIELMKASMTVTPPSSEYIRLIARLAKTGCKQIIYRDMEYVRDIIIEEKQHEHK